MKGIFSKIIVGLGIFWLGVNLTLAKDFSSEFLSDNPNITLSNTQYHLDFFLTSVPSHSDKGNKKEAEEENQQEEQEQEEDETNKNEKNEKRKRSSFFSPEIYQTYHLEYLPQQTFVVYFSQKILTRDFYLPIYIRFHNLRN